MRTMRDDLLDAHSSSSVSTFCCASILEEVLVAQTPGRITGTGLLLPQDGKAHSGFCKIFTRACVTRMFRSTRSPCTQPRKDTRRRDSQPIRATRVLSPCRYEWLACHATGAHAAPGCAAPASAVFGIRPCSRTKLRRISIIASTCSIETGQFSSQARQVVHDHSTASVITSPSMATPTYGSSAPANTAGASGVHMPLQVEDDKFRRQGFATEPCRTIILAAPDNAYRHPGASSCFQVKSASFPAPKRTRAIASSSPSNALSRSAIGASSPLAPLLMQEDIERRKDHMIQLRVANVRQQAKGSPPCGSTTRDDARRETGSPSSSDGREPRPDVALPVTRRPNQGADAVLCPPMRSPSTTKPLPKTARNHTRMMRSSRRLSSPVWLDNIATVRQPQTIPDQCTGGQRRPGSANRRGKIAAQEVNAQVFMYRHHQGTNKQHQEASIDKSKCSSPGNSRKVCCCPRPCTSMAFSRRPKSCTRLAGRPCIHRR